MLIQFYICLIWQIAGGGGGGGKHTHTHVSMHACTHKHTHTCSLLYCQNAKKVTTMNNATLLLSPIEPAGLLQHWSCQCAPSLRKWKLDFYHKKSNDGILIFVGLMTSTTELSTLGSQVSILSERSLPAAAPGTQTMCLQLFEMASVPLALTESTQHVKRPGQWFQKWEQCWHQGHVRKW